MPKKSPKPPRVDERTDSKRTDRNGKAISNRILQEIPENEYRAIRPALEFVAAPRGKYLYEPNEIIESVYFPNRGLISLVIIMKDGKTAEVGVLGNEGFTGAPAMFGLLRSPICEVAQIAGDGFKVAIDAFGQALRSSPSLQALLERYAIVLGIQISQTAACNRVHHIVPRLARWLLMAQDRVGTEHVDITHDFLATMLGTDRSSVSLAAANLQRREIIDYTRGAVRILNRTKLEASACECYGAIQRYSAATELKERQATSARE
jgi:CRP-like cAMP-binding protein